MCRQGPARPLLVLYLFTPALTLTSASATDTGNTKWPASLDPIHFKTSCHLATRSRKPYPFPLSSRPLSSRSHTLLLPSTLSHENPSPAARLPPCCLHNNQQPSCTPPQRPPTRKPGTQKVRPTALWSQTRCYRLKPQALRIFGSACAQTLKVTFVRVAKFPSQASLRIILLFLIEDITRHSGAHKAPGISSRLLLRASALLKRWFTLFGIAPLRSASPERLIICRI